MEHTIIVVAAADEAAAMARCHVLLINSLQDGMNLVAKEWAVVAREAGIKVQ